MKNFLKILLFSLIFLTQSVFAQEDFKAIQTLSPKEIFVGDTAELSYTFYSSIAFPMGETDFIPLTFPKDFETADFSIISANFSKNGNQYRLTLNFIPWKVGFLEFPEFDLLTLINPEITGYKINFDAVEVASIVDKTGKKTLRSPLPPILIPGTIYFLLFFGILLLIFVIAIIRILCDLQNVLKSIENLKLHFAYSKNARQVLKKIKKILKKGDKITDSEFSEEIQKSFRKYLAFRFDENFVSVTTNKIYQTFVEITGDTMSEIQSENVEILATTFARLDYIRFAQNSIDSQKLPEDKFKTEFLFDEREKIAENLKNVVKNFEKGEKSELKSEEIENIAQNFRNSIQEVEKC